MYSANVKEVEVEIVRNLRNDLRLAYATCAPDMQGHTLADQRMKRLVQLGRFHLDLPREEYWFGCEERQIARLFGNALDCRAGRFGAEQRRQYKLIPE